MNMEMKNKHVGILLFDSHLILIECKYKGLNVNIRASLIAQLVKNRL